MPLLTLSLENVDMTDHAFHHMVLKFEDIKSKFEPISNPNSQNTDYYRGGIAINCSCNPICHVSFVNMIKLFKFRGIRSIKMRGLQKCGLAEMPVKSLNEK